MDIQLLSSDLKTFLTDQLAEERGKLETQIKELGAKFDDHVVKSAFETAIKRIDSLEALINKPGNGAPNQEERKTLGQMFVESPELKNFLARGWVPSMNAPMVLKGNFFSDIEYKTTIDSSALGNATYGILNAQRLPGVAFAGERRLRVRDLLPITPTDQNAVDFIRENAFTNAAYPQTEGSAKAESAMTFEIASAPVRTIAHWIPATRQALADAAWLRGAIDRLLRRGLLDQEDFELLRGDGTGNHLTGLMTAATAFDSGLLESGDTLIDQLSKALEQLEAGERQATGIVIRPSYWRKITRIKTEDGGANTGNYIMGGPANTALPRLWDIPVVMTNAMPPGKFLVGDFASGAEIHMRMEMTMDVSNSHSTFFTENKVAILAEERLALSIRRADYFVSGNFNE